MDRTSTPPSLTTHNKDHFHTPPSSPTTTRDEDWRNDSWLAARLLCQTQPLSTWLNSPSPCTCASCPINFVTDIPHSQGRYLHNGEQAAAVDEFFGSNNPPPELWEASERWGRGEADDLDKLLIEGFARHHVKVVGDGDGGVRGA